MKCLEPQCAVAGHPGPWIQQYGIDLYLYSNSNENKKSYSHLGSAYKIPSYDHGSTQANEFLTGSHHFKTLEIEMYSKQR